MRERPAVVFLGTLNWSVKWQRAHHLARELARRGHRVVYMEPELVPGAPDFVARVRAEVPEGVTIAALPSQRLEYVTHPWSAADNERILHGLLSVVDSMRLRCPVLLVQSPLWQPVVSLMVEETDFPVVYDCVDEHRAWPTHDRERVGAAEEQVVAAARLVTAPSATLAERLQASHPHVRHVGNGCDPEHFAAGLRGAGALRPGIEGPIAGYVGDLSPWVFDADLVAEVAGRCPDWTFAIVGPAQEEVSRRLAPCANVVEVGQVPYRELPDYVADFDVAILPFRENEVTRPVEPVKLWEYLAAGRPVVATPLPLLLGLGECVRPAAGAEEFAASIRELGERPPDPGPGRALAEAASWSRRVDDLHPHLLAVTPSLDIVVIARGDPPERLLASLERDDSHPGRTIVADAREGGVAAAVNRAVASGRGRFVLLLAEDVLLPAGGTLALVHALARSRATGVVVPATTGGAGREPIPAQLDGLLRARVEKLGAVRAEVPSPDLSALVVRREHWEAVGGLDELAPDPGAALAEAIRGLHRRVECCQDAIVYRSAGPGEMSTLVQ
jgi:O-antigen biosynthesis protein